MLNLNTRITIGELYLLCQVKPHSGKLVALYIVVVYYILLHKDLVAYLPLQHKESNSECASYQESTL